VVAHATGTDPFAETEDQAALRGLARDVARREVAPRAQQGDATYGLQPEAVKALAAADLFGVTIGERWGGLDIVVHAIAFADKAELQGRFVDTSRENFRTSLTISCHSLIDVARRARPLMTDGGSIITLTYQGSTRVTPNYNVMGVAKAALEAAVRYLADDLGREGIRVNAISPGPMKTLAGAAIGGARATFRHTEANAPLRANATLDAIGGTAVWLASDAGRCTTGEVVRVDGGYHVMGMPRAENL